MQLEQLLSAAKGCRLFQGDDGEAYALIPTGEVYPIRSRLFDLWLRRRFYEAAQERRARSGGKSKGPVAPNAEAVGSVLNALKAETLFDPIPRSPASDPSASARPAATVRAAASKPSTSTSPMAGTSRSRRARGTS